MLHSSICQNISHIIGDISTAKTTSVQPTLDDVMSVSEEDIVADGKRARVLADSMNVNCFIIQPPLHTKPSQSRETLVKIGRRSIAD